MARTSVFKLHHIFNYFHDDAKSFSKGDNAYESGHVTSFKYDPALHIRQATVKASQKNLVYDVTIEFDDDGTIREASKCSCPRGLVKCHHMAAALIHAHHNVSCTDKPCAWINKGEAKTDIKTVDELYPSKDYAATSDVNVPAFKEELFRRLRNSMLNLHIGFSWLLGPEVDEESVILHNLEEVLHSEEFLKASDKARILLDKVKVDPSKAVRIERSTIGQAENACWLIVKRFLLTASNFGLILAAIRSGRYPESFYKKILGAYDLDGVKAVAWGRENEATAKACLENACKVKLIPCGIFVHDSGLLGASPDAIIDADTLVEIKCPYSWRDTDLEEGIKSSKKGYILTYNKETGNYNINETHQYYDQIQGQLFIANRKSCILAIWNPTGLIYMPVERNNAWAPNLNILIDFYCYKLVPYLLQNIL